jgi:hypothetical protein
MNSTSQLDLHPDVDSLNAFAEQALGVPEREQILAHLAACSRCRQVIFLAQQAAAEAPVWIPSARPTQQSTAWNWKWRLAWVPATALAAALALMVTFHPWRTTQMPELAKVAPLNEPAAPTPAPKEFASAGAAHKPTQSLAAKPFAGNAEFAARSRTPEKLAQEPASSAALSPELSATAPSAGVGQAFLPSSIESAPQQETTKQYQPEPAVAAWQQERQQRSGTLSASADVSQVSHKSMKVEAYTAHASRQAASAGPRMVQQSQSVPASSIDIVTQQQQLAGLTASRKANPPTLPSGLAAVSNATVQHLTLEIDLAGTLYLSDDSGGHWEAVARQWTGRAVEVRAKTGLSGNTAQAGVFELKNDAGSTWASADGKTWSAQ